MNYRRLSTITSYKVAARRLGLMPPVDGYTIEEKQLEKLITENTVGSLYGKLPTHRMKAIVALHFELGYPQTVVAEMLGIKQPSLLEEIGLIQRILLGKPYKPRKKVNPIKIDDLFKVLLLLQNQ